MGQLFNRIRKTAKASFTPSVTKEKEFDVFSFIDSSDDSEELKRLIDQAAAARTGSPIADRPADAKLSAAYDVLGLSPEADADAIRSAYLNLMKKYHPDRSGELYSDQAARTAAAYQYILKTKGQSK